eukprot:gene20278-27038_t
MWANRAVPKNSFGSLISWVVSKASRLTIVRAATSSEQKGLYAGVSAPVSRKTYDPSEPSEATEASTKDARICSEDVHSVPKDANISGEDVPGIPSAPYVDDASASAWEQHLTPSGLAMVKEPSQQPAHSGRLAVHAHAVAAASNASAAAAAFGQTSSGSTFGRAGQGSGASAASAAATAFGQTNPGFSFGRTGQGSGASAASAAATPFGQTNPGFSFGRIGQGSGASGASAGPKAIVLSPNGQLVEPIRDSLDSDAKRSMYATTSMSASSSIASTATGVFELDRLVPLNGPSDPSVGGSIMERSAGVSTPSLARQAQGEGSLASGSLGWSSRASNALTQHLARQRRSAEPHKSTSSNIGTYRPGRTRASLGDRPAVERVSFDLGPPSVGSLSNTYSGGINTLSLPALHKAVEKLMMSDSETVRKVTGALQGISSLSKETDKLKMGVDASGV